MKEDLIKLNGKIIEILKGDQFKIELENGNFAICNPSGRIRQCKIWMTIGDKVQIELSPYDLTKGRIVYREKN